MRDTQKYAEVVGYDPMHPNYSAWEAELKRPKYGLRLISAVTALVTPIGNAIEVVMKALLRPQAYVEKSRRFCEGRDAKPGEIAMVKYHPED